MKNRYACKF